MSLQVGIRAREMVVAEEAPVGRQRRGVNRAENQMLRRIDKRRLTLGVAAPEDEHQPIAGIGKSADHVVGEPFPPFPLMRSWLMSLDGERGV